MTSPASEWRPDWRGQAAAIIASGPSAKHTKISLLRDRVRVLAIKENHELAPWADVVYGCDRAWWRNRQGLHEFTGLKISQAAELTASYPDIRIVKVDNTKDKILLDDTKVVGSGGNSGFQALNLAVQFGADRILLIGFDMHARSGVHWYGRNNGQGRSNPSEHNFKRWRAAFEGSADMLKERGVDVVNASLISELTCFRVAKVDVAMAEWGV